MAKYDVPAIFLKYHQQKIILPTGKRGMPRRSILAHDAVNNVRVDLPVDRERLRSGETRCLRDAD
jgi:hypothetical protein